MVVPNQLDAKTRLFSGRFEAVPEKYWGSAAIVLLFLEHAHGSRLQRLLPIHTGAQLLPQDKPLPYDAGLLASLIPSLHRCWLFCKCRSHPNWLDCVLSVCVCVCASHRWFRRTLIISTPRSFQNTPTSWPPLRLISPITCRPYFQHSTRVLELWRSGKLDWRAQPLAKTSRCSPYWRWLTRLCTRPNTVFLGTLGCPLI